MPVSRYLSGLLPSLRSIHFTTRACFIILPRRAVLSCLIHMKDSILYRSIQYKHQPRNLFHTLSLSPSCARKTLTWPPAMRVPRPSLVPRLLLLTIIATVVAAVPLLFWSRRYALISSSEGKVHSSSSKAKDCLKRESLALHSHSALSSVTARHVGCASGTIITCNCGSQREMQCLQRRCLLRQPLLL